MVLRHLRFVQLIVVDGTCTNCALHYKTQQLYARNLFLNFNGFRETPLQLITPLNIVGGNNTFSTRFIRDTLFNMFPI